MKTTEVNKEIIGKRCECMYIGEIVKGVIEDIENTKYSVQVKVRFDEPHQWGDDLYREQWLWGRKMDGFGPLKYLQLLPEPVVPAYETLTVTFTEPIRTLDGIFTDVQAWGVASLKEWIDSYESTRFMQIGQRQAVITSEYNMTHVKEWLKKNTPIETYNDI